MPFGEALYKLPHRPFVVTFWVEEGVADDTAFVEDELGRTVEEEILVEVELILTEEEEDDDPGSMSVKQE
jgi:hypothetical protein